MSYKTKNYKSAQVALNTAAQPIAAAGTTVEILGSRLTDTGCSVRTDNAGFKISASGLYNIRYVFTFVADTAGVLTAQLYKDGVALPCSLSQDTVEAGSTYTIAIEAPALVVGTCCNICPTITAMVSSVAGTITRVCASVIRLA